MIELYSTSKRIEYIDYAKGFTILLVIIGHLGNFCWKDTDFVLFRWLTSFQMPLFFYLSGLVANKAMKEDWRTFLSKKVVTLCFPFFFIGSIWVCLIHQVDIVHYWFRLCQGAYWFLFCLFEIFVICYCLNWLCNRLLSGGL
jgi:fucose 4-O-acetylase-like acetyltransferase